jgi:hypothetical protein
MVDAFREEGIGTGISSRIRALESQINILKKELKSAFSAVRGLSLFYSQVVETKKVFNKDAPEYGKIRVRILADRMWDKKETENGNLSTNPIENPSDFIVDDESFGADNDYYVNLSSPFGGAKGVGMIIVPPLYSFGVVGFMDGNKTKDMTGVWLGNIFETMAGVEPGSRAFFDGPMKNHTSNFPSHDIEDEIRDPNKKDEFGHVSADHNDYQDIPEGKENSIIIRLKYPKSEIELDSKGKPKKDQKKANIENSPTENLFVINKDMIRVHHAIEWNKENNLDVKKFKEDGKQDLTDKDCQFEKRYTELYLDGGGTRVFSKERRFDTTKKKIVDVKSSSVEINSEAVSISSTDYSDDSTTGDITSNVGLTGAAKKNDLTGNIILSQIVKGETKTQILMQTDKDQKGTNSKIEMTCVKDAKTNSKIIQTENSILLKADSIVIAGDVELKSKSGKNKGFLIYSDDKKKPVSFNDIKVSETRTS